MIFKNLHLFLISIIISTAGMAQHKVSGSFPTLAGQQVKLVGFQDFGIYTIDSTSVSKEGKFELDFAYKDLGIGYLSVADNKAYFIVLDQEGVQLKGESLGAPSSIEIISGVQNRLFTQYASEHPRREQALSAWDYLAKIYDKDALFNSHKPTIQFIQNEKQRIKAEDSLALAGLDESSYLSWYLPNRKLVSSVSTVAQYRPEDIPAAKKAFRKFDYSDDRLYKSGLLRESIENHIWLLENSSTSLEAAYEEMYISIDSMIESVKGDSEKLNKVTNFLFKLLEKHSLFKASEYLSLKVLNLEGCTIDDKLSSQLESYRAMKVGNIAPDFNFAKETFSPSFSAIRAPKKLSDIKSKYTLLIFGSSWCPACPTELMEINGLYKKWNNQGLEVVFFSLDDDPELFKNFISPFPFISTSDFQKWDSPIVKNYHVFATPTMFLLNNKREIILRPNDTEQLDSWVDWYLINGNK